MKRLRYLWPLIAVCALLLAACGDTSGGGVRDATPVAPSAGDAATTPIVDEPTAPAVQPGATAPATDAPTTPATSSGAGEPYKLGVVLSITGPAASLGVPMRDTLLMLQEQANSAGGIKGPDGAMHQIELTIIDDKSVETETVLAIKKLLEQQVLAIIGPNQTGTTLAVIPLVTEAQVPLVSLGSSSKIVEPIAERKWIFKTPHNDRLIIQVLMEDLKRRQITNVAFLSVNNALGDTGREAFATAAQSEGIKLVVEDRYGTEDTDMSSQVSKVKAAGAQALINWSVSPPAAVVTKNAIDQGLAIPLYHGHGIGNDTFLQLAGPAAEGVRLASSKLLVASELPDSDPMKPVLRTYAEAYTAKYNAPISAFGGIAWDAFQIVTQALSRSGADRAKLRDEIERTKEFVGANGIYNYSAEDHHGLDERSLAMIEVRGGKWTLAK